MSSSETSSYDEEDVFVNLSPFQCRHNSIVSFYACSVGCHFRYSCYNNGLRCTRMVLPHVARRLIYAYVILSGRQLLVSGSIFSGSISL